MHTGLHVIQTCGLLDVYVSGRSKRHCLQMLILQKQKALKFAADITRYSINYIGIHVNYGCLVSQHYPVSHIPTTTTLFLCKRISNVGQLHYLLQQRVAVCATHMPQKCHRNTLHAFMSTSLLQVSGVSVQPR